VDEAKSNVGYELPFTRHFDEYRAARPLEEIEADMTQLRGGRPLAGAMKDSENFDGLGSQPVYDDIRRS
jgi:hypothetical protein